MLEVFIDTLIDTSKVLAISFVLYVLLSFFEEKLSNLLKKHKKISPILGASAGLIPQCGLSVIAADLYLKEAISMGCLFAVFFSCSDEALPILFSSLDKAIYVLPLLGLKFIFGFLIGYLLDLFIRKKIKKIELDEIHIGCCHHEIDHIESKIHEHLFHPLIHSIKISIYVFIVSFLFGTLIYIIGEESIQIFLSQNKYVTPIVCGLVGLIPNCASSVLLSELFILNGIPFGALFTGLSVNAGLGLIYLLKHKTNWKNVTILLSSLFISAVVLGYFIIGIMNFL